MFTSCSVPTPKEEPQHVGVDPILKEYQDEFFELAAERGIQFHREVTMGFSTIKPGLFTSVIGTCTYGGDWREIDIDRVFFSSKSYLQKKALLFHEMIHCYCTRSHTYGSKARTPYPDGLFGRFVEKMTSEKDDPVIPETERPYFDDGCARSIMHPLIVSSNCMFNHYSHYIDEMFNRCRPW